MAASTAIERGEITEIYFPYGKFLNDQRPKFQQASFCLLRLFGDEYIMPVPVGGNAEDLKGMFNSDNVGMEQVMGACDFGFYNGNPIYSNENEWGGWQTDTSLKGLHTFSRF